MDILERRVYRGPSVYAHFPVMRLTLDNGALEIVSKVCASPALVPQRTFDKLRADKALGPMLAAVERGTEAAPVRGTSAVRQGGGDPAPEAA